ncbi:MAG: phytanoyl-CoA dioxygenase family protein [Bdellovibrionales bacterium]|nr:phytanoyl-CoA dioxygenase family protein [Bdellovibrionales bacterium]
MGWKGELTKKQIDDFHNVGFFSIEGFWDPQEVAEMREAFQRLYATAQKLRTTQLHKGSSFVLNDKGDRVAVARVVWAGAAEPVLLKYGADPRLLRVAAQLLGSKEMDQLINQAHFKMPGDGVGFPWHQDVQHRDKKPGDWRDVNGKGSYVQTLTALDPITKDNGPVLFIPGSHTKGRIDFTSADYASGEYEEFSEKSPHFDISSAVPAVGGPGTIVIFGPYTVHGSYPNKSQHARFSFLNGYAYPGANSRVYPGEGSGRRLKAEY